LSRPSVFVQLVARSPAKSTVKDSIHASAYGHGAKLAIAFFDRRRWTSAPTGPSAAALAQLPPRARQLSWWRGDLTVVAAKRGRRDPTLSGRGSPNLLGMSWDPRGCRQRSRTRRCSWDELEVAGCWRVFTDHSSDSWVDR